MDPMGCGRFYIMDSKGEGRAYGLEIDDLRHEIEVLKIRRDPNVPKEDQGGRRIAITALILTLLQLLWLLGLIEKVVAR